MVWPVAPSFVTQASTPPPSVGCKALTVGKLADLVSPYTTTCPALSTAMDDASSKPPPPRYVEYSKVAPVGSSLATKASALPAKVDCKAFVVGNKYDPVTPQT